MEPHAIANAVVFLQGSGGFAVMRDHEPSHLRARWLYLRILGVLLAAAFLSFSWEIVGLAGPNGLFPAREYLSSIAGREPDLWSRVLAAPTVAWLGADAVVLRGLCWVGGIAAVAVVLNRLPRLALVVCWVCYLSLLTVAPRFSWYPSDSLLVETTFLSIFAAPAGVSPGLGRRSPLSGGMLFLYQWLLFRLMLETGTSKLLSSDPIWRSLGTMDLFFETSPFPTWLAWFADKLPHVVHMAMTANVLFTEVAGSVLLFLGRRMRLVALAAWTVLQTGIVLTGNFNTFNYNSIALAVLLAGDEVLGRVLPLPAVHALETGIAEPARSPIARWQNRAARVFLAALFLVTCLTMLQFFRVPIPAPLPGILDATRAFRSANIYVLYPFIPRQRRIIVFEGSDDAGATWKPYPYRFQTGRLDERPRFIAPLQPRFDREAMRPVEMEPMAPYTQVLPVQRTAERLLEGEPSVVALFAENPFPAGPPDRIRTVLYRYRFTDLATLRATGNWWSRDELGVYSPEVRRDRLVPAPRN